MSLTKPNRGFDAVVRRKDVMIVRVRVMINCKRAGLTPPWMRGMHRGYLMILAHWGPVRLLYSRAVCDEPSV